MATTQRLELKQTVTLSLTPQLSQAISLLQMSNIELQEFLEQEIEKNPLLEVLPPREPDNYWASGLSLGQAGGDGSSKVKERVKPLREFLAEQIRQQERDKSKADLACRLVDELDETGFLSIPNFELVDRYDIPQSDIESALDLLQSCEPTGIGARDIKECLLLQLNERQLLSAASILIIENLDSAVRGDFAKLARDAKLPVADIENAYRTIRTLNPKPSANYESAIPDIAPPDVIVTKASNENWRVELNPATLPKLIVDEEYASEIAKNGKEAKVFVHKLRNDARFLLKAVDTRAKNLLNVATYIVQFQSRYFVDGVSELLPLKLSDIASSLSISESTVSRVTKGKYLYSPQGMRELNFFLSGGIINQKNKTAVATTAVRDQIFKIISQESKEMRFTDEVISRKLSEFGIEISRRTVSKYRKKIGIGPSNQRRRLNT